MSNRLPLLLCEATQNSTCQQTLLLDQAIDQGGDATLIADAQQALDDGDALRASEEFGDAIDTYEVALADAEDALK